MTKTDARVIQEKEFVETKCEEFDDFLGRLTE